MAFVIRYINTHAVAWMCSLDGGRSRYGDGMKQGGRR